MNKPGVILTFDTSLGNAAAIQSWMLQREFFKSQGMRFVFFVGGWGLLSQQSKNDLRLLEQDGHEIALHTETHKSATDAQNNLQEYIRSEIKVPEAAMVKDGFKQPVSFAYANCQTNDYINSFFENNKSLDKIKFIRACTADAFLSNDKVHGCVWLDNMTQNGYKSLIDYNIGLAAQQNKVLVLASHSIFYGQMEFTPKWSVNIFDLYSVINTIKSKGLAFYTYRDMLGNEKPEYKSYFNEEYYLSKHQDVKWAVENNMMTTGEDHFNMFGKNEGREYSLIYRMT